MVKECHPIDFIVLRIRFRFTSVQMEFLLLGGRPIMAEHPEEVEEITKTADALMLNLGNITDVRNANL